MTRAKLMLTLAVAIGLATAQGARSTAPAASTPWEPVATFSVLGYDPDSREVGGAVQSRVFSVGNGVLWGEADAGMVATQAIVDVSYGPQALALLRKGLAPKDIVKEVWEKDPDPRPQDWPGDPWFAMRGAGRCPVDRC